MNTSVRRLCGALMILSLAMPISAMGTQAAGHAGSVVHVSATVLAHATTKVAHQATHITITEHDVKMGYVDAHEASIFIVTALPSSTYFLVFHPRVDIFSSVRIKGLESQVVLGPDGGEVIQSGLSSKKAKERSRTHLTVFEYELSYRFMIKPGIRPGTYDWPLQLTVRV
jgi:hypothetical protein